ncbi:MAG: hypothetical protein B655_0781 [Methanobacterium sp. Maddingley MBC34]|nr:MAG: hypothetical protein B655_0781 [Methanobacterium sp. Maddingley MBC34]
MVTHFELKTEDELLIFLAQTSMNPDTWKRVNILFEKKIDWDYILDKASSNGLMPLLYFNLKNYSNEVPEDISNSLKDYFVMNTRKNLLFLGEMLKLHKIFENNNITFIPYKGPIMAVYNYGSLSLREFADLDIFIDKKDFSRAKKILLDENYETVLKLNSSKEVEYLKSQREYKFKNMENGLILEIQWNVVGFSFSFSHESSFPINQDKPKFISINNKSVNIFSDEDLLLILSLHIAGHLWSRLSWVCDIVELIKKSKGINWNQIIDKAHYLGIERILYLNLSLSHSLFDLKLPENVQEKIKEDPQVEILEKQILKLIFSPENFSVLTKVNLRFKIRENKLNGFKDILRILAIPQSDEWHSFEEKGTNNLLYIFKRPLQIIKRLKE